MTILIFVRHGESEFNNTKSFAGQMNPPLTQKGKKQAQRMAQWLAANYKIDYIYSSDLTRAYQTAEGLAERLQMRITKNAQFREINGGQWQGENYDKIKEKFPDEYSVWLNDIAKAQPPKGETVEELADRILKETFRLKEVHKGENVVIVTHATPIRLLMTFLQKGDISMAKETPWVPNASITVVRFKEDTASFELLGYDEYLREEKSSFPKGIV